MVHYLGKDIQNELMQILAGGIKNKILSLVKSAKYYSIILDCTPDVSHIEQMTMIIRFVDIIKPLDSEMFEPAELETEVKFEPDECRRRLHKRQFKYKAQDEVRQDPKQKFKVEFYYTILDMAIQSIEERFQQLEQHNILFGFLYDISNINKKTHADILTDCKHLETSLTHNANKDIDAYDLCNELQKHRIDPKVSTYFQYGHEVLECDGYLLRGSRLIIPQSLQTRSPRHSKV
ncbi:hypothetical protein RN001_012458 [Aquatica leii]|uniref:DUF4371 domain-containing protein n=1 Tax=Aquatica leii TaxID=1421715 RepID=A0AAN7P7A9_9COLE|nr:hypothetical protein RN001_012458 [Aquatica leii]